MRTIACSVGLLALLSCGSTTKGTANQPLECATGTFVEAVTDDGHGVDVTLAGARLSGEGYKASPANRDFYCHDKGSPTRAMAAGDQVWLARNEPSDPFKWRVLDATEAKRCPPVPGSP